MRKNLGVKSAIYPQPVLVLGTYSEDGSPNVMTASWGAASGEDEISLFIDSKHKTTENFIRRGAFTVSMAVLPEAAACDYVGLVSAYKVPDKFERAGFHALRSELVDAPLIEELPLALECTVKSYDKKTEHLTGKVINVSVDENFLTADGKPDLQKMQILAYDTITNTYFVIANKVGNAFKDGAKYF